MKIPGHKGLLIQLEDHVHARFRKEARLLKLTMQELGELLIETFLEQRQEARDRAPVLRKAGKAQLPMGTSTPDSPHRSLPVGWVLPERKQA